MLTLMLKSRTAQMPVEPEMATSGPSAMPVGASARPGAGAAAFDSRADRAATLNVWHQTAEAQQRARNRNRLNVPVWASHAAPVEGTGPAIESSDGWRRWSDNFQHAIATVSGISGFVPW